MGINFELAKKAEKIAEELSKKNRLPTELNLPEAYDIIIKDARQDKKSA